MHCLRYPILCTYSMIETFYVRTVRPHLIFHYVPYRRNSRFVSTGNNVDSGREGTEQNITRCDIQTTMIDTICHPRLAKLRTLASISCRRGCNVTKAGLQDTLTSFINRRSTKPTNLRNPARKFQQVTGTNENESSTVRTLFRIHVKIVKDVNAR